MMAFDGRILRANASLGATPRRAMFAIAKTPSFATGVAVRATRSTRARRERAMKTNAKYGDESVYFDLSDVEATTGSWDVYGVDASSRYPDQQAAFFEYAAQGLGRREAVYSLLAVSAGLLTVGYGVKGAKDAKLPITVGPQQPAVVGPRDRI